VEAKTTDAAEQFFHPFPVLPWDHFFEIETMGNGISTVG